MVEIFEIHCQIIFKIQFQLEIFWLNFEGRSIMTQNSGPYCTLIDVIQNSRNKSNFSNSHQKYFSLTKVEDDPDSKLANSNGFNSTNMHFWPHTV